MHDSILTDTTLVLMWDKLLDKQFSIYMFMLSLVTMVMLIILRVGLGFLKGPLSRM